MPTTAITWSSLGPLLGDQAVLVERSSAIELASAFCLISYASFVACLVYLETRRLNQAQRHESGLRAHVEGMVDQLKPYLSPQLLSRENDEQNRKRLTIFFSDIEGFTRLMDEGDESLVAHVLGEYLDEMTRIARLHGGTIDKFMGDSIMAVFKEDHQIDKAVEACLAIRKKINELPKLEGITMATKKPTGMSVLPWTSSACSICSTWW